jgi:AcrR family transcriptional regulator
VSDLRGDILQQATKLLLERGYRGLSMREIAEAVGVSKAALYYHFKDKEQLFLAILEKYLDQMAEELDEIRSRSEPSRRKISRFVGKILSRPAEQRAVIRLSSQELAHLSQAARKTFETSYHSKFIQKLEGMIKDGIDHGEIRRVDPHVAAWAILGMMYPYFYPAHSEELPPANQVAEDLVSIFLDGLAA